MHCSQLTAALDKKEALLVQLRAMNDEAASGRQKDPITNRHSETFQRAYAAVVLQLKQAHRLQANMNIAPTDGATC